MRYNVTVYGASDDLIEVDGAIREEFVYGSDDDGDLIAFSNGTVLRVRYDDSGVWRITPVVRGHAELEIRQAPEGDDTNYSDRAIVDWTGTIAWVVHGSRVGCAL